MPQGRPAPEDHGSQETVRRFPDESAEMALETPGSGADHPSYDEYGTLIHPTDPGTVPPTAHGQPATPTPSSGTGTGTGTGGSFIERGEVEVEPGQVIFDKYQVLERLGKGGMGEVWLVKDQDLDVKRALKMITRSTGVNSEARARFRREARAMARFAHPNVVAVFDARMDRRDTAYIVMEYAPGQSLEKVIRPGQPMSLEWTLFVLGQLCEALGEAHAQGIIHRDLKPSNLMLVPTASRGQLLKVLDFGIAKILKNEDVPHDAHDAQTMAGDFMGTPPYASPEQATGHAEPLSDIYSVGVILYEFLTGYRPFSGKPAVLIANTMFSPPPSFAEINPDANVPAEVERVVIRCLSKTPEGRPSSPMALLEEFKRALPTLELTLAPTNPATTASTRPSATLAPTRPREATGPAEPPATPRRPARLVGAGLALLGVLGLAAFGLSRLGGGPVATGGSKESKEIKTPPTPAAPKLAARVVVDDRAYDLFRDRVYLPAGYEPVDPTDLDEAGYPRALSRDGVRFLRIPGGKFRMGARGDRDGDDLNRPAREVEVAGFYLQKFEVTSKELLDFVAEHPDRYTDPAAPETWRTWHDQAARATDAGRAAKLPARQVPYRLAAEFAARRGGYLPTEAEWEYAARSGDSGRVLVWDERLDREMSANLLANLDQDTMRNGVWTVAGDAFEKDRTEQGVMALAGNVREWCRDAWVAYDATSGGGPPGLPTEPAPGAVAVVRGASFKLDSSYRYATRRYPGVRVDDPVDQDIGFRLAIECPPARPGR